MSSWYKTVNSTDPLMQGDILYKCPVFFPDPKINYSELSDPSEVEMQLAEVDVIVMTQSCDLQQCHPNKNIVLCPLADITSIKSSSLQNLKDDKMNKLHLLNKNSEAGEQPQEYMVVDFSTVFTLPFGVINNWKSTQNSTRPQLIPPYIEHMSQRFGMTFMRVGTDDLNKVDLKDLQAAKAELTKIDEANRAAQVKS